MGDEEVKEGSPKPKKRQNNNNNNNNKNKDKKLVEAVSRHDKKEGKERTTRPRSTETTRGRFERGVGATQPGRSFNLNPVQLWSGRSSHLSSIQNVQEYHISLCNLQCKKLFIDVSK